MACRVGYPVIYSESVLSMVVMQRVGQFPGKSILALSFAKKKVENGSTLVKVTLYPWHRFDSNPGGVGLPKSKKTVFHFGWTFLSVLHMSSCHHKGVFIIYVGGWEK